MMTNYETHLKKEKKNLLFRLWFWWHGIKLSKDNSKIESDILEHMFILKECEPEIKRALRKSAKHLIKTSEYDDRGDDFHDVEPEEALMNIFESYLKSHK